MNIRTAKQNDCAEIVRLLMADALPVEGVDDNLDNFLLLEEGDEIIGCVGLEFYDKVGLLRSLAVTQNRRGNGYGKRLTEAVLNLAGNKNIETLYLLTETAEKFFEKFGFSPIHREHAGSAIKQSSEFKYLCPDTAVLMIKNRAIQDH